MTENNPTQSEYVTAALSGWIQPQHLVPPAMDDCRHRFQGRPEHYLVIDDFLLPEHTQSLKKLLLEDGIIETFYKTYQSNDWVAKEQFEAVDDDQRFIHEGIYVRPRPDRQLSRGVVTDMMFRTKIREAAFHHWLATTTGRPIGHTGKINLKKLGREHALRWHSDAAKGRLLCAVLYLHDDWRPEYGGRLMMQRHDGGVDFIDPLSNRLVLFDPQSKVKHAVEPMTDATGDWARLNYSAWFYNKGHET